MAGVEFSAPADMTTRTLNVYVGVFAGRGDMEASLSDDSAPDYSNAHLNGSSFTFSFPTEIGKSYSAQVAPSLSAPIDWQMFTSVTGNGSLVTVTNLNLAPEARFYRVRQP